MAKTSLRNPRAVSGLKWSFRTAKLLVECSFERLHDYRYDGDDEDGQTQALLGAGTYVAFETRIIVALRSDPSVELGGASLYGSVYARDAVNEFITGHRDPDPENRNTLAMKARGTAIGHYFPDMVREACQEARKALPRVRA